MALFNRALLLEQTGDMRGAIRDYSKVIEEYPNFWFGLQHRAACYRRLGQTRQAEADEFRVLKAQIDKRYGGKQPKMKEHKMRKRSDDDVEKYNHLVVADEQEMEHEYKNAYRGRVQNRRVEAVLLPMFELTFERRHSEVERSAPFDRSVEAFNAHLYGRTLYVGRATDGPSAVFSQQRLDYIDSLTAAVARANATAAVMPLLLLRAVAYAQVQNLESAIDDLTTLLQTDSTNVLGYWQRAVCQAKINDIQASEGTNIDMKTANVLLDLSKAVSLAPQNAYLYYNRGCLYARRKDYAHAEENFSHALTLDVHLAEAYYNRGVVRVEAGRTDEGVADLSKAGELGLYDAYSLIKKYRKS
jgi:tetratricopeptide (TPR) repeat protein